MGFLLPRNRTEVILLSKELLRVYKEEIKPSLGTVLSSAALGVALGVVGMGRSVPAALGCPAPRGREAKANRCLARSRL